MSYKDPIIFLSDDKDEPAKVLYTDFQAIEKELMTTKKALAYLYNIDEKEVSISEWDKICNAKELLESDVNDALQWEIDWINNNQELYESPLHIKAVIGNITKRYFADKAKKLVEEFAKKRTTGAMFAIFEHFGESENN